MYKKIQATSNLVPVKEGDVEPSTEVDEAASLLETFSDELKKEREEQLASSGIDLSSLEETEGEGDG